MSALAVLSPRQMKSEALGIYVRDELHGVAQKLIELKPYIAEVWRRLESGETILGCTTKKQFCKLVKRDPRTVRYMLAGGNNVRTTPAETFSADEIRWRDHSLQVAENHRKFGDFVTAAIIVNGTNAALAGRDEEFIEMSRQYYRRIGWERYDCGEERCLTGETWAEHFAGKKHTHRLMSKREAERRDIA